TDQTSRNALTKPVTEYVTYGNPVGDGTTKEELKDYDLYRTVTVSFKDGQPEATITYSPWTTNTNGDVKLDADGNVSDGTDTINVAKLTTNELQKQPGYTESFANTATGATLTDDQKAANVDVSLKIAKDANNSPIEIDRAVNYAAQKQTGYVHYVYGGIGGPEIAPEKTITGDAGTSYADQYTIPETIKATKNTDNKITDIDGNVITDNDGTFDLSNYYYSHTEDHGGGQFDYFDDNTSPDDTAYNTKGQDVWVVYTAKPKNDAANWQVTTNTTDKPGFTTVVISDKNDPKNVINTFNIPDGAPGQDAKIQTLIVDTDPVAATDTTAAKVGTHTVYFYSGEPAKDTDGDGKITEADIKPNELGSFVVKDGATPVIDSTGTPGKDGTVYNITEDGKPVGSITIPNAQPTPVNSVTENDDKAGTHTTYFYTGDVPTKHADGSAITPDSPLTYDDVKAAGNSFIGDVTTKDGASGKTPAIVPGTHVDSTDKVHGYTPFTIYVDGNTASKDPKDIQTFNIPDGADGKAPALSLVDNGDGTFAIKYGDNTTNSISTPTVHSITVDNGDSHTVYFYTGKEVTTPANGKTFTASDVPAGKGIGQVTIENGKGGTDTSVPVDIHSFTVTTPGSGTTPTKKTVYFYTGAELPEPAKGTEHTEADIPAGKEIGSVDVENGANGETPKLGLQDNHDGTFTLLVDGKANGDAVGMPTINSLTVNNPGDATKDIVPSHTTYFYTGSIPTKHADGSAITADSPLNENDIKSAEIGHVVTNDGKTPTIEVAPDPKDNGDGSFTYTLNVNGKGAGQFTVKNGANGKTPTITPTPVNDKDGKPIGTKIVVKSFNEDGTAAPDQTYYVSNPPVVTTADKTDGTTAKNVIGTTVTITSMDDQGNPISKSFDVLNGTNGNDADAPTVTNGTDAKTGGPTLVFTYPNGTKQTVDLPNTAGDTITATSEKGTTDHPNGGTTFVIKHANGDPDTTQTVWNGNNGVTPKVKEVDNPDGTKSYVFYEPGPKNDGSDDIPLGTVAAPKDGITPVITQTPIMGGTDNKTQIGTTVTISTPGSNDKPQTINITNGKDGATPVFTPEKDDAGNTIGYTISINGNPAGEVKNGTTPTITTKPATDANDSSKVIGTTLVIDGKDSATILNGAKGDTGAAGATGPQGAPGTSAVVTADVDGDGNPTGTYTIKEGDKVVGTLKDGATPQFEEIKDDKGQPTGYNILVNGKIVGTVTNGKDGSVVTTKPILDNKGKQTGVTIDIDGKDVTTLMNGTDGAAGPQGPAGTPGKSAVITPTKDDQGKVTGYTITDGDGNAVQVTNGKDGATPSFVKTATGYDIMLNNTKVGEVKNGEDGATPMVTTKPAYSTDIHGNTTRIGTTLVINGMDEDTILNGTDGISPVFTPVKDTDGNVTGYNITLGDKTVGTVTNGKDGSTPQFTEVKDGDKVTGYTITVDGKPVGSLTNGKDGSVVTTKPVKDSDGNQIGVQLFVNGQDGGTILNGAKGDTGAQGPQGASPVITPDVDGSGKPTGTYTIKVGDKTVGQLRNGKDGSTPQFNPVKDNDGNVTGYDIMVDNNKVGTITNGKDGATPVITQTPTTDADGKTTGTTITITTPGSKDAPQTISVTNGKDGSTPVLTPEKDDNGNVTGYAITINGNPGGELKNGKDGSTVTTKPALDKDGNQIGVTLVIDGKDGDTILNGKDGASPVITPEKDKDGNPTGTLDIVIDGKTVGTLQNGKDGSTPTFNATKDDKGNVTGYDIVVDGKTVGTIKNGTDGSDGKTPVITQTPEKDTDGNVIGTTITINTPGSDQPAQTINISNGKDGTNGKTPQVKAVPGADGKTSYVFYTVGPDGKEIDLGTVDAPKDGKSITVTNTSKDDKGNTVVTFSDGTKATIDKGADGQDGKTPTVKEVTDDKGNKTLVFYVPGDKPDGSDDQIFGNVPAPKDGYTPQVEPVKDNDGKVTSYEFYYTNDKGEKVSTGIVPAPKDGSTPTVKPYTGTDGKTGYTFTLNGVDYNVTNGVDGAPGKDGTNGTNGTNGKDLTILNSTVDGDGATVITFSDGQTLKIPAGAAGKDGQTPLVKTGTDNDGNKTIVFYTPGTKPDGSDDTVVGTILAPKDGTNGTNGTNGKDGQTPSVKPLKDADGNITSYEFYIPGSKTDGSDDQIVGNIPAPKNGKDGATPVVTPHTGADGKVDGYTFTLNGVPYTVLNGKDGANGKDGTNGTDAHVTSFGLDKDGNTVLTFNDGKEVTVQKGKDGAAGQTPTVKEVTNPDGTKSLVFYIPGSNGSADQVVGTIAAPKDGTNGKDAQTPDVKEVTNPDGTKSYEFFITNPDGSVKTVGNVPAPKDGETPTITPNTDAGGNVTGYTLTLNGVPYVIKNGTNGKDGAALTIKSQVPDKDGNTLVTFSDGSQITVYKGKDGADGKDGETPQVKAVVGQDGKTSYVFYTMGQDGKEVDLGTVDAPKDGINGTNGKDGQTPQVKEVTNSDGSKSFQFYITNPDGSTTTMGNVPAPKDGETPKVTPHTDAKGNVDGYTFTINGQDYLVKNGQDGKDLTVKGYTTDKDGNTVVTFSDGSTVTVDKGAKGDKGDPGETPQIKAVTGADGKTSYQFFVTNPDGSTKTVGTVDAPKDGKDGETPSVEPVKDANGNTVSYEFYYTNDKGQKVSLGTVDAPKDGETPQVKPHTDSNGDVDGYTFTLDGKDYTVKNGEDAKPLTVVGSTTDKDGNTVITFSDKSQVTVDKGDKGDKGDPGTNGKDGQTPQVKAVVGQDGKTSYVFYTKDENGKEVDVGTVDAPKDGIDGKDGQTPSVKEVTNSDGSKSYEFYITNPDGSVKTLGNTPAPKDGETPTVTPHKDSKGNVDGYTFTIGGHDYTVTNGQDGKDITVKSTDTDAKGNIVVTFSDDSKVTIPKGTDGKDAPTPEVKAVPNADGTTSYEFYITNPDGSTKTIGTVAAPKDGKDAQTPSVKEVTNNDGSKSYEFYITNPDGSTKTVGTVPAPKDGETPKVTETKDTDGNVDGYVFTIDGKDYTVKNGKDGKDGKDGQTPQVKEITNNDGSKSYEFFTTNPDGSTKELGNIPAPKDGQAPKVKEVTNADGSKSYEFYITNPDGSEKSMGTVAAPKDGVDGKSITVKSTDTDAKGNIVVTFSDGNKVTIPKGVDGKDGQTPQVKAVPNADGTTSYEFYITNPDGSVKTVGTVPAPKNGQTPSVKEVTANDGSKSYEFYITNPDGSTKTVGTVPAPKDGQTPTVTPHKDSNGKVDGYTFTLDGKDYTVTNGKDITVESTTTDKDGNTVVTFSDGNKVTIAKGADGKDGVDGKDGQTPEVKAVVGQDGVTHYEFYVTNPDGSTKTVGNVIAPKDGKDGETPLVQPVKDANGNTVSYEFYYTNDKGQKVLLGTVDAPKNGVDGKDGETPTVAPHYDANGVVDGWTFTLDGHHYIVKNGQDGKDGKDGKDITIQSSGLDSKGNTVINFSDGSEVTVQKGQDGKDGQTPSVKAVTNADGTTSYVFYVTDENGKETTVGTVAAPKDGIDGKTPHVEPIKGADGTTVAYNFYYTNADGDKVSVGRVDAPKDGATPTIKPFYDADGNVTGWTLVLNGTNYVIKDGKNGVDGKDGKDGQTPVIDPAKTIVNKEAGTTTYYFTYPDGSNAGSIVVPNGGGTTNGSGTGTGTGTDNGTGTSTDTGKGSGVNITNTNNQNNGSGTGTGTDNGQGTNSSTTTNTTTTNSTTTEKTITTNPDGSTTETDTTTTTDPSGKKVVKVVTIETIPNKDGSTTTKTTTTTTTYPAPSGDNGGKTTGDNNTGSTTTPAGGNTNNNTNTNNNDNGGKGDNGGSTTNGGTTNQGGSTTNGGTTNQGGSTTNGGTTNQGGSTTNGGTTNQGGSTTNGGSTNQGGSTTGGNTTNGGSTTGGNIPGGNTTGTTTQTTTSTTTGTAVPGGNTGNGTGTTSTGVDGGTATTAAGDTGSATTGGDGLTTDAAGDTSSQQSAGMVPTSEAGNGGASTIHEAVAGGT
ncbi:hypothetical protein, partial [Secundilactobacillus yichangensis]|uniref:hypothetical protein n=1 Tax=Secundilactobacillus yichangensis TaxID=2799580 RepID=UPI0019413A3F